jgi:fatty acid desaturase
MIFRRQPAQRLLALRDPDDHEWITDSLLLLCAEYDNLYRKHDRDHHVSTYRATPEDDSDTHELRVSLSEQIWADEEFWRRIVELELGAEQ